MLVRAERRIDVGDLAGGIDDVRGAVRPARAHQQRGVVFLGDDGVLVGGYRELAAAVLGFLGEGRQLVQVAGGDADHRGVQRLELVDGLGRPAVRPWRTDQPLRA